MKIKLLPFFFIFIFLIIFFIFYKGLQNSGIYKPKVNIEKNIPSFTAKIFNSSDNIRSEDIFEYNKFYLVNIWASWCIPCRKEHLYLMSLYENDDMEIIGLNYKDNTQKAEIFLNELGNPYKFIISDLDGTVAIEWGAYGVPETFLINKKKIIKKIIGPINEDSFLEIKKIIK